MSFLRSRTQILYRYMPGALFEHDKYGICRVNDVSVTSPDDLNIESLKSALSGWLRLWKDCGSEAFPDPNSEWSEYKVGVPDRVNFEAYPTKVQCTNCGHIADLTDLARLPIRNDTSCTICKKGHYRQLAYVVIHECGKMMPVPIPSCPTHGAAHMNFRDTGRFVTSEWICQYGDYRRGMPRYSCDCAYSRGILQAGSDQQKRNDKYARTNDTSVFYSHTVHFVNLPESAISVLRDDEKTTGLLLARQWGIIQKNIYDVAKERKTTIRSTSSSDQERQLLQQLLSKDPQNESLKKLLELKSEREKVPFDVEIDRIVASLPGIDMLPPSLGLLEHVAILDWLKILLPNEALKNIKDRGDTVGAYDFEAGMEFAKNSLGIQWIGCITDFPVAMASVGYSRVSKNPGNALINPFRSDRSSGGKVPIYTVTANTEAIMLQLDHLKVIRWLIENKLTQDICPDESIAGWIWLRSNLPRLALFRGLLNAPSDLSISEQAVISLLHTISHLLMRQVEWSGFDPESISEYIIPETLTIIIHSNNYTSFSIGGMFTMFEQRLNGWLKDTYNAAFSCVYNPICQDEGASCVGCLHRQYNCEAFNQYLSRSTLQGGVMYNPKIKIEKGFWISTT